MNSAPLPSARIAPDGERTHAPPPRLGVGPLGIFVRIVFAVGILMSANIGGGLLVAAVGRLPDAERMFGGSSPGGFALAGAVQLFVCGIVMTAVWAWMRWVERRAIRVAGWRWGRLSIVWLLLGVAVSALSLIATASLLPSTGPVVPVVGPNAAPALLIVYVLGLAFLQQGIPEELLFRGFLLWRLRERPILAITVTTLAFTVIHLVSSGGQQSAWEHVLYLAIPFGFSLLAVGLLLWTGSLWAAAGVHGGFHVGYHVASLIVHQVDPVTSWLAVGGVQAVLGLVLIVTALGRGRRILVGEN